MACICAQVIFGLISLLLAPGTLGTKVDIEDLCDTDCKLQDRVVDYSRHVPGFTPKFNFSVGARATENINPGWRYSLKAHFAGLLVWQSSGTACGKTLIGDNVILIVTIGFPSCGTKSGNVTMPVSVLVRVPLKATPIYANVSFSIENGLGESAAKFLMRIGGWYGDIANTSRDTTFAASSAQVPQQFWPGTHIEARNLCDSTCLVQGLVLNVPIWFIGPTFKFNANGRLSQKLPLIRFGFHAVMHILGKFPVSVLLGNGTACGKTTTGDGITFGLELDFPSCPDAEGIVSINGHARFTLPLDVVGRLALSIDMIDDATSARVASILVQLHFGTHDMTIVAGGHDKPVLV